MTDENKNNPWTVKSLQLSLGGENDENGFITIEIFDDTSFDLFEGCKRDSEPIWSYGAMPIKALMHLRDFLNYALPKNI